MGRKKIALVGLGAISQSVHLPLIARLHDQIELVAVVDLSPQRTAEIAAAYGNPLQFSSSENLLAADVEVDGAVIAAGGSHAADTELFLSAGVPVLSEKPLAYSQLEHEELKSLANDSNLRIGYMKEYDPASRKARQLLKNVSIRAVEVEVLHPADSAQLAFANLRSAPSDVSQELMAQMAAPTRAAVEAATGTRARQDIDRLYTNVILGSVVHDIALLRYLVGGIGSVESALQYGQRFPGSLFMRGGLKEHDAPWSINWHFIEEYPQYRETVTVHHETGTVQLVFDTPYLLNVATELNVVSGLPGLGVDRSVQTWQQIEAFEQEWRDFLSLIDGDPQEGASLDESAADIKVAQMVLARMASSQGLPFPPTTEVGAQICELP